MNNFNIELASQLYTSTESFPVDFDREWAWLGYARKDYGLAALKANFVVDVDFRRAPENSSQSGGRPSNKYYLTKDCFDRFKRLNHKRITSVTKPALNYVYVIGDRLNNVIKIGVSKDPGQRLSALQTSYPWELDIWKSIQSVDAYKSEANLHKQFAKYRMKGEWFNAIVFKEIKWGTINQVPNP